MAELDAAIMNGDAFAGLDERRKLLEYLARWQRVAGDDTSLCTCTVDDALGGHVSGCPVLL